MENSIYLPERVPRKVAKDGEESNGDKTFHWLLLARVTQPRN